MSGGFQVAFADAEPVSARNVVLATGVLPYFFIPPELSSLPSELVSHTADHRQFDQFKGRRVAIVGSGSSALETAALLHEAGGEVHLVVRCPDCPIWGTKPLPLTPLVRIRENRLCEGWKCPLWNSPTAFRRLPQSMRVEKARTVLGPLGAWWLKPRVEGVVDILRKTQLRGAEPSGSGVRLQLEGPSGRSSLEVDHVIAGTGFRVNIDRLDLPAARPPGAYRHVQRVPGAYPCRRIDRSRLVLPRGNCGLRPRPVDAVHRRNAQCGTPAHPVGGQPLDREQRPPGAVWVESSGAAVGLTADSTSTPAMPQRWTACQAQPGRRPRGSACVPSAAPALAAA